MKLSKKENNDLQELGEIVNIHELPISEKIYSYTRILRNHIENKNISRIYGAFFGNITSEILDYSIYHYHISKSTTDFAQSLYLVQRLKYLKQIIVDESYSGYDCAHIWDMTISYITNDKQVIENYLTNFKGPFKNANKFTKIIANLLHKYLGADFDFDVELELNKYKPSSKFEGHVITTLKSIFSNDQNGFNTNIENVIKGYKRTEFGVQFEKYFPKLPIFLVLLNEQKNGCLYSHPVTAPFIEVLRKTTYDISTTEAARELCKLSAVLYNWITFSPTVVDFNELGSEMFEKFETIDTNKIKLTV